MNIMNFACDLGVITDMSIQRGGETNAWTVNGLPTSVEISLSLRDLIPQLVMANSPIELNANVSTLNFLTNLAGTALDPSGKLSTNIRRRLMNASAHASWKMNPVNFYKGTVLSIEDSIRSVLSIIS